MVAADDIPQIAAALAEFIAAPEPYIIGGDPALDLRVLAAELRLLPALLDSGGCFGLHPSGEVMSFPWDEPRVLRSEPEARVRNIVVYRASLKYPSLAALVPHRPANAVTCPSCGGSGRCLDLPVRLAEYVVCSCGGLGWLAESAEPNVALRRTRPAAAALVGIRKLFLGGPDR